MASPTLSGIYSVTTTSMTGSQVEVSIPSGKTSVTIRFVTSATAAAAGSISFVSSGTGFPVLSGEAFRIEIQAGAEKIWVTGTSGDTAYFMWQTL